MESTLLLFKGVHYSAKNAYKMFVFVFKSVTHLLLIKTGEVSGIFCRYKLASELNNRSSLATTYYMTFLLGFLTTKH